MQHNHNTQRKPGPEARNRNRRPDPLPPATGRPPGPCGTDPVALVRVQNVIHAHEGKHSTCP